MGYKMKTKKGTFVPIYIGYSNNLGGTSLGDNFGGQL